MGAGMRVMLAAGRHSHRALPSSLQDPTDASAEALLAQMLEQFHYSYDGNRAPFGLYLHTPWCAWSKLLRTVKLCCAAHCACGSAR